VRQVNPADWAGKPGLSKFALQDYPKIYGLVRLVYKIATNQINTEGHCGRSLRATKLVLIAKKPTGIRPIAVGETLRRIAGRFVTRWLKDKIISALGPYQYAMQSNGTTKLVLAARNTLEKHPDFVMLAPDAKNAFNAQSRRQGITRMCEEIPGLTHQEGAPSTPRSIARENQITERDLARRSPQNGALLLRTKKSPPGNARIYGIPKATSIPR